MILNIKWREEDHPPFPLHRTTTVPAFIIERRSTTLLEIDHNKHSNQTSKTKLTNEVEAAENESSSRVSVAVPLSVGCRGVGGSGFGGEVQPAGSESAAVPELRDGAGGGSDQGLLRGDVGDKEERPGVPVLCDPTDSQG